MIIAMTAANKYLVCTKLNQQMSAAYFKITNMDNNVTESSRLEPSERVVATKGGCSLLKRCSTG